MKKEVLAKFLSNKCSFQECQQIADYFENNQSELDKIEIFENLKDQEIIQISDIQKHKTFLSIVGKKKHRNLFYPILIAALILIFGVFSFLKVGILDNFYSDNTLFWKHITNNTTSAMWHILPDGSRVKLEANAQIAFRLNFAKDRQLIQIKGEVTYFVHPNKLRPFRVINQGVETKAVGTAFTILDYDDISLLIKLLEGKIAISGAQDNRNQFLLENQEIAIVNKKELSYKIAKKAKTPTIKSWASQKQSINEKYKMSSITWSNQLVKFKGVSNADLFSIMEQLYDVSIDVSNPEIIEGNFTGELYQNDNLENLLTIFCQINGCKYTIENKIIRIR